MGMFDWYRVAPGERCPYCGSPIGELQGKQGRNLLLVWRQGQAMPADQRVDSEHRSPRAGLAEERHPSGEASVYGNCVAGHALRAVAVFDEDGTWTRLDLSEEQRFADEKRERERLAEWRRQS